MSQGETGHEAKGGTSRREIRVGGEFRPLRTGHRVRGRWQGDRSRSLQPTPENPPLVPSPTLRGHGHPGPETGRPSLKGHTHFLRVSQGSRHRHRGTLAPHLLTPHAVTSRAWSWTTKHQGCCEALQQCTDCFRNPRGISRHTGNNTTARLSPRLRDFRDMQT